MTYGYNQEILVAVNCGGIAGVVYDGNLRDVINTGDVYGVVQTENISSDIFLGGIAGHRVNVKSGVWEIMRRILQVVPKHECHLQI